MNFVAGCRPLRFTAGMAQVSMKGKHLTRALLNGANDTWCIHVDIQRTVLASSCKKPGMLLSLRLMNPKSESLNPQTFVTHKNT